MTRALLLAASLALVGCGGFGALPDATPRYTLLDSVGPSVYARQPDAAVVAAQARLDLPCAAGVVARGNGNASAFRAEGCGQAITYVAAVLWGERSHAPAYRGWGVMVRRFVPVSRDGAEAALAALDRDAATLQLEDRSVHRDAVDEWVELYRAAARDLACPRESLVVDIVGHGRAPSTYLAEGCGSRGLFVRGSGGALVITSRVALTPGPPESTRPGAASPP